MLKTIEAEDINKIKQFLKFYKNTLFKYNLICFFFSIFGKNKNQIDMKKALKLFPYSLFMVVMTITSCEYCDDDNSDNQSISQEKLQNQEIKSN